MLIRSLAKSWIPVVVWMMLLFVASGDAMSPEHTSRFLVPFLRWIAPGLTPETVAAIQFLVRKTAHLMDYAILAALLWRAFRNDQRSFWKTAALAFAVTGVYAALDEVHQSFVPSRTGSARDVLIDCVGALIGLMICLLVARLAGRRKSRV